MMALAALVLSLFALFLTLSDERAETDRLRREANELRTVLLDTAAAFDRLAASTRHRDFTRFANDLRTAARWRAPILLEELTGWQRLKRRLGLAWREPSFCPHPEERRYTSRCSGGDGCDVTACGDCGVSL